MGRRKKAVKKAVKKVRPTVAKIFKCLFCNNEKSVQCSLDYKSMTGQLQCAICNARYQTSINKLTEPIDIFTEWLDESAEAQTRAARKFSENRSNAVADLGDQEGGNEFVEADDDDGGFIVDGDEEGGYEEP